MIATTNGTARCIHCTFHAQRLHLQSLRVGRHIHLKPSPGHARDESTRYSPRPPPRNTRRRVAEAKVKREGFVGRVDARDGLSPIRKFITGSPAEKKAAVDAEEFEHVLSRRIDAVKEDLKDAPLLAELGNQADGRRGRDNGFDEVWSDFSVPLLKASKPSHPRNTMDLRSHAQANEGALRRLRDAWATRRQHGLDDRIKYEFYHQIISTRFTKSELRNQTAVADLRYPSEWYPATRSVRRKIHLHVGPTNSGKTYHALQRLEQANSGVYAGPLRLLAHEVYSRMNAKGKPCYLITGEERRAATVGEDQDMKLSACTVEMMPLNHTLDVAIIDEIQMIGNAERGWAWTQALLGVKAAEVHLCGEERTVPLIREICASLGESLEIHRYQRLSPLKMADRSLDGDLSELRKGDCVVSFSVMGIHSLRRQIESATGKKVATVYGSLPPETRAQQARLFNDPDNDYDYLVASDAVGMGLNLAIKRIIFEASSKFDGAQHRTLGVADIKQIAGRAGRYRTAAQATDPEKDAAQLTSAETESATIQATTLTEGSPEDLAEAGTTDTSTDNVGLVTTLQKFDFPIVAAAMTSEPESIQSAGLFPPAPVLERFAAYFPPRTPFSYILTRLHEASQMHPRFHLCGLRDQLWLADLIEPIQGLTISDRNIICSSPASISDRELWKDLMPALAKCVAEQKGGSIVDIKELPLEALEAEVAPSREYLRELERLHKGVVAYLWLSYRFAGVFQPRSLAFHVKAMVEEKIEAVLGSFSFSASQYRRIAARRQEALLRDIEAAAAASQGAVQNGLSETDETAEDDEPIAEESLDDPESGIDVLRKQTSLTAGGDYFGGEGDLGLEDPIERDEADAHDSPKPAHSSAQPHPSSARPPLHDEGNAHAGRNQLGGIPPKHLSHIETDATEVERAVESRP